MSQPSPFTSSVSRRGLSRRRPARLPWRQLALILLVVAICVGAFAAGHHGL